jgi:hypothetical protein
MGLEDNLHLGFSFATSPFNDYDIAVQDERSSQVIHFEEEIQNGQLPIEGEEDIEEADVDEMEWEATAGSSALEQNHSSSQLPNLFTPIQYQIGTGFADPNVSFSRSTQPFTGDSTGDSHQNRQKNYTLAIIHGPKSALDYDSDSDYESDAESDSSDCSAHIDELPPSKLPSNLDEIFWSERSRSKKWEEGEEDTDKADGEEGEGAAEVDEGEEEKEVEEEEEVEEGSSSQKRRFSADETENILRVDQITDDMRTRIEGGSGVGQMLEKEKRRLRSTINCMADYERREDDFTDHQAVHDKFVADTTNVESKPLIPFRSSFG